jgi:hypothetical protein
MKALPLLVPLVPVQAATPADRLLVKAPFPNTGSSKLGFTTLSGVAWMLEVSAHTSANSSLLGERRVFIEDTILTDKPAAEEGGELSAGLRMF